MFRLIFCSFKRSKAATLLLIIQLSVSFLLIQYSIMLYKQNGVRISKVDASYSDTMISMLSDKSDEDTLLSITAIEKDVVERQRDLLEWLRENKKFTFISSQLYNIMFFADNVKSSSFISDCYNESIVTVKAYRIDEMFNSRFPLPLIEGRTFCSDDYLPKDTMPVILGDKYREFYKVGDSISVPNHHYQPAKKLEVIGFVIPGAYLVCPRVADRLISADSYIIYPFITPGKNSTFSDYDMIIFQSFVITSEYSGAKIDIIEKSRALNLYEIDLTEPIHISSAFRDIVRSNGIIIAVTTIIACLFATFSLFSLIPYKFSINVDNYGKYMICGASKKYVSILFVIEMCCCVFFCVLLSFYIARRLTVESIFLLTVFCLGIIIYSYIYSWTALQKVKLHEFTKNNT